MLSLLAVIMQEGAVLVLAHVASEVGRAVFGRAVLRSSGRISTYAYRRMRHTYLSTLSWFCEPSTQLIQVAASSLFLKVT